MMTGNRGRMRIEGGGVAVLCSFLGRFLSCGREPVDFTRQKGWAPISTWPRLCPPVLPPSSTTATCRCSTKLVCLLEDKFPSETTATISGNEG